MPEETRIAALDRRALILAGAAGTAFLGLAARSQAQQGETPLPFLPARDPLNQTQEAQCALAEAIAAAGEDARRMTALLQAAMTRLATAVRDIGALLAGADAAAFADRPLPIPKRFAGQINAILAASPAAPDAPGFGEIETYGDYLTALRGAAAEAAQILAGMIERQASRGEAGPPLAEWDSETLRLFELVMAMQLLNASAVGFNS